MDKQIMLELRKKIKSRKPEFSRQDSHKKKRLGNKWRRPKGIHSKIREHRQGHKKQAMIGYCSPRAVMHLHRSGLKPIAVHNIFELEKIKKNEEGALIAKIGKKKKIEVLKKAKELGIMVLNVKDIDKFIEEVKKEIEEKKKSKKEKTVEKKEKKKEAKEEKLDDKVESDEEKKKREKEEKDKILTQKV